MRERLQKILSAAGVSSRRAAERLIRERRVSLNGVVVDTLGVRADPDVDEIRVDERRIGARPRRRYVLLNKPRGFVSTRSDPQGRPTVLNLLPTVGVYLYPVGRLDYDSEGLLLLTNDGELASRMTHPRYGLERVYEVRVRGVLGEQALGRLARGVTIEGRRTAPASVAIAHAARIRRSSDTVLVLRLREGRKRQVRLMCEAVGHPVIRLRRVQLGPLHDRALRPGRCRDLTASEIRALKTAVGLVEPSGQRLR